MTSTGAPMAGTIAADHLPGVTPPRLSSTARSTLLVVLVLVGVADLAVLDAMVFPRYLAARARSGLVLSARDEHVPAPVPVLHAVLSPPPTASLPAPQAPAVVAEIPTTDLPAAETPEALPPLLFWRNAAIITNDAQKTLERLLDVMNARPTLQVRLDGHTDDLGPLPVNRILSLQRARAARAWLVDHGINEARIEVRGFGSAKPVDGVIVPSARPQNRRVEVEFR